MLTPVFVYNAYTTICPARTLLSTHDLSAHTQLTVPPPLRTVKTLGHYLCLALTLT